MENKPNKIFVNGFISKDIPETTPEFILGKDSLHVPSIKEWINANEHLADEKGFINTVTLRSKSTGKRYREVDTWKPTPKASVQVVGADDITAEFQQPVVNVDLGEVNPKDVPF